MFSPQILDRNNELLETILKWRIISVENLMDIINYKDKVKKFNQKIYRLEKHGLLRSTLYTNSKKIIYPSEELLRHIGLENKGRINKDNMKHDAAVTAVISSLIEYGLIQSSELPHEYKTKSTYKHKVIEPDAILKIKQGGETFTIALEVELNRKDRSRIYEKMIEYAKAFEYDYIFYFFMDQFSFNSYCKRVQEIENDQSYDYIKKDLAEKLVLIHNQTHAIRITNLGDSRIFHNGRFKTLKELIGV